MRFRIILVLLFSITLIRIQAQNAEKIVLMPVPKNISILGGSLPVSPGFSVSVHTNVYDTILIKAVNRMYQKLNRRTLMYFNQPYIRSNFNSDTSTLQIYVQQTLLPVIGNDESYSLNITRQHIILKSVTSAGALHGLETILQLLAKKDSSFYFPAVEISDAPRFPWRGFMIDVSRHFIPLDIIKRNLEAMAAVKMNVMHFHLTDNEGFRIESKLYPHLQISGSNGDYYTQAQITDLIAFAQDRGITIVPEFDMPGHTKSWFAGYPQLASAPGPYQPGSIVDFSALKKPDLGSIMQYINTSPFPAMDPSKENTYQFLDKFLGEMAALFPAPYMHIGADENNGVAWRNNPEIIAFMKKNGLSDTHALQAYFVYRAGKILNKYNKRMIGWEELFSTNLSKQVIVQVWQNPGITKKSIDNGNQVLISAGFYLDHFMPAYIYYNNVNLSTNLPDSLSARILGGEAAQWTEIADQYNIETRIWPRAAAIAERLWSAATVKDVEDMYRRLFIISSQLDGDGLQHIADYERGLRQMTDENHYDALKTLTDVLTPVKGVKKLFAWFSMPPAASNQTAPLATVSDIVFVDSKVKWEFRKAVQLWLVHKDAENEKIITSYLKIWQNNDDLLKSLFANSTVIRNIQEHSGNLSVIANIGLESLNKSKENTPPTDEWVAEKMNQLKKANQSFGETELSVIPEIEALVNQKLAPLPVSYSLF